MEDGERHPDQGAGDLAQVEDAPRYTSFRDYVDVVRRHWLLIAIVTAIFAAGAFVYSSTRPTTYRAAAHVSLGNLPPDFELLGIGRSPLDDPVSEKLQIVVGPGVARRTGRALEPELSAPSVQDRVTALPTPNRDVEISATGSSSEFAAELVKAYARAAESSLVEFERDRLEDAESLLLDQIEDAQGDPDQAGALAGFEQQLSRLRTLEEAYQPPRVTQPARVAPDLPEPHGDTVLGALVGIMAGLLLAFGRAALDRRLHTPEEAHRELGLPVLARIGEEALGRAGLAIGGAGPVSAASFEGFRALRMSLDLAARRPLRSVVVTSGLPEEGKSTVSMGLASASALAGKRTLLVECDPHRPCFAERLGIAAEPGLTDYLRDAVGPQSILQTVDLAESAEPPEEDLKPAGSPAATLVCIAAGTPVRNYPELLVGARFKGFIAKVSKAYDLVVLDASPLLLVVDSLEIATQVDGTIVCVRTERTTRDQARAAAAALAKLSQAPLGAVVIGGRHGGPGPEAYRYGF